MGQGRQRGCSCLSAATRAGRKGLQGGVGVTELPPKRAREAKQEGEGAGRGLVSLGLNDVVSPTR